MGWGRGSHWPTRKSAFIQFLMSTDRRLMPFTPRAPRYTFACRDMAQPPVHTYGGLLQSIHSFTVEWVFIMDHPSGLKKIPPPVNLWCAPGAGLSNVRTITGKRSCLNCCLDFGENLHFCHAGSCKLASIALLPLSPQSSVHLLPPCPAVSSATMLCLKQRMRC